MASVISEYVPERAPTEIKKWEGRIANAATADEANTQLLYQILLQLRTIKQILLWVMVFVPLIIIAVALILSATSTTHSTGF